MLLHLVMDKSWMKLGSTAHGRTSQPYFDGVNSFLEYAAAVGDRQGNILCPCRKCVNCRRQNLQEVHLHLFQYGIVQSYTTWHEHGEPRVSDTVHPSEMGTCEEGNLGGIDALVEDRIRADSMDTTQREEVRNFDKLLNDAQRDIRCHRDDVDAEIISEVVPSDGILEDNVEAEADEEQEIFEDDMDVDMDVDMDYDL
ncbi:hypothetical protein RHGRI_000591 [Rhododendron griersonianum]|uniref:Transposase-associated domain-containing protein n=1 Tax=Rhododendron griersonianum TaxID=479676 RepID=A0AAV6LJF8_9ERIC|nr:hypothetical protein RHGRI_033445 [Rhododendron griersonianum]KAG5564449.1 hypothetical protein RHGRI_000591 [Rhododendron griersonianum]